MRIYGEKIIFHNKLGTSNKRVYLTNFRVISTKFLIFLIFLRI